MNISIRKWKIEDAEDLRNAINNKKVQDNLRDGIPYPYTAQDAKEFILSIIELEGNNQYAWAITDNDKAIGSIGVFRKENVHHLTAEMGYYISEEYWGKGVMTKVAKDVSKYIFENTDIVRIFAEPYAYNTASCRVLEKAGFDLEGILRKNAIKNGEILDMKIYSIIKNNL